MAFGKKVTSASGKVSVPADGRVHATVYLISMTSVGEAWGRGNALDSFLQDLQDQGAQILNVTCFASGKSNDYVQAVIVYRAPLVSEY